MLEHNYQVDLAGWGADQQYDRHEELLWHRGRGLY